MSQNVISSRASALETNKVIRNTYTLLSVTLGFSALMAGLSMMIATPPWTYLACVGGAFLLMWLVLPKTQNSSAGLGVVFGITGLLGFGLGPILNMYLAMANGGQVVMTALGGTAVIFLSLSAYALTTRKDFSYLGGMLMTGMIVIIVAALANIFLQIPAMSLAISAVVIMIMSGFILYDTSRMIHDGQANYLMMTVGLYLSIYNIFIHLLAILGIAGGND